MLNWAARYFPILRVIKQELGGINSLLELGSGSVGVGKFHYGPFVGCDLSFPVHPVRHMLPVVTSGTMLPFSDGCFEAAIISDVLEHVPPEQRMAVVQESLRVTRKVAVFGFPSGPAALDYDRRLAAAYARDGKERPVWLQEHMLYPFPTESLFEHLSSNWSIRTFGNENVGFHYWTMQREMHRAWIQTFRVFLAAMPNVVEWVLERLNREPYYRKIIVVRPNHVRLSTRNRE